VRALDLFAGTGWGVACKRRGIREMGIEIMPEAIATRAANGMATIYHDVWEGLVGRLFVPPYDLLIASPPCQTFSPAGNGSGRRALDEVLEAVRLEAWKDPAQLIAFGERHDMRTALVLAPLAHIWRDRPRLVALEQVPTVLPVWHAYADVMRRLGYSVQVANLHAEQYGVPQTRKRAILVARLDGPVALPMPTHSRYYSHDPKRLDQGVLPWVSMADALGWKDDGYLRSNYGTGGDASKRGERPLSAPAPTVTSKVDRNRWVFDRPAPTIVGTRRSEGGILVGRQLDDSSRRDNGGRQTDVGLRPGMLPGVRVTGAEAAALQSYPVGFQWRGANVKQFLQIGNAVPPLLAESILAALTPNSHALSHSI
jgi:DNA (cytosine-5)-methyltransferase 1